MSLLEVVADKPSISGRVRKHLSQNWFKQHAGRGVFFKKWRGLSLTDGSVTGYFTSRAAMIGTVKKDPKRGGIIIPFEYPFDGSHRTSSWYMPNLQDQKIFLDHLELTDLEMTMYSRLLVYFNRNHKPVGINVNRKDHREYTGDPEYLYRCLRNNF